MKARREVGTDRFAPVTDDDDDLSAAGLEGGPDGEMNERPTRAGCRSWNRWANHRRNWTPLSSM
jgi:hypothetical protein